MRVNKGIVILGEGDEIDYLVKNIEKKGIPLIAYGPSTNSSSEAYRYCKENTIRIIDGYEEAVDLEPEFIFMMSYAPLIPQKMIEKVKFINVHGALLPRYRGMHGGTWALINGEEKAGYTIHLVDQGIDSGPIYFQSSVDVGISETIISVREKIKTAFEKNILSQLEEIYNENISYRL
ncbi:formyltransferase family protein [Vibrio sp.]|uniref:formyltransferase family protein n=1 Tax=Vibrio sp. TaxID=678 RepID=UPI00311F95FC